MALDAPPEADAIAHRSVVAQSGSELGKFSEVLVVKPKRATSQQRKRPTTRQDAQATTRTKESWRRLRKDSYRFMSPPLTQNNREYLEFWERTEMDSTIELEATIR